MDCGCARADRTQHVRALERRSPLASLLEWRPNTDEVWRILEARHALVHSAKNRVPRPCLASSSYRFGAGSLPHTLALAKLDGFATQRGKPRRSWRQNAGLRCIQLLDPNRFAVRYGALEPCRTGLFDRATLRRPSCHAIRALARRIGNHDPFATWRHSFEPGRTRRLRLALALRRLAGKSWRAMLRLLDDPLAVGMPSREPVRAFARGIDDNPFAIRNLTGKAVRTTLADALAVFTVPHLFASAGLRFA